MLIACVCLVVAAVLINSILRVGWLAVRTIYYRHVAPDARRFVIGKHIHIVQNERTGKPVLGGVETDRSSESYQPIVPDHDSDDVWPIRVVADDDVIYVLARTGKYSVSYLWYKLSNRERYPMPLPISEKEALTRIGLLQKKVEWSYDDW
jgi:hypothetical protein